MKKIISFIALLSLIMTTNFWFYQTFAVETNQSAWPWTMQKARHLAKKSLFWATQEHIENIYSVGSAQNAVNYLFPSRNGPSRDQYQEKIDTLTNDPDFDVNDRNDMYEYYLAKKLYDPYEAKAKLFLLFEDTFSVNVSGSKNISYLDIENTHDLLYDEMFWDYKTLIKKSLYDRQSMWDYSVSQFLDLFNQSNPARPNENYARELVQLLLMWEYLPFQSWDIGSKRNYEETDVASLAKILVWFETNENTHDVDYNTQANTNTTVEFLSWAFQNNYSPAYYNQETWIIDIQLLKQPIGMNNGLPDNIIDYIFAKRQNEIAQFLALKLYNFYVWEEPTTEEINQLSTHIQQNNFDIYLSVKWLLSHDMMYTNRSMNTVIYKNPVDLVVWTKKILWIDNLRDFRYSLQNLGWTPYMPGSIFWRDGFENNSDFFNATSVIKWSYEASKMVDEANISDYVNSQETLENNIRNIEKTLIWEDILSNSSRELITDFMTQDEQWNQVEFQPDSQEYNQYYTTWLLYFILSQPEYILQSWVDIPQYPQDENAEFYGNDNKLVIIKYRWGLDWLHGVIPKDEYNLYLENRWDWSLQQDELVDLWDYYLNAKMSDFKDLYDSWDLKIFNRVWTPSHSRAHDTASRMMTSAYSQWNLEAPGILWEFIQNENPLKTVQLWWDKSLVFRGWKYLQIWNDWLFRVDDKTNNDFRTYKLDTLKNIYNQRIYPQDLDYVFKNWAYIWNVAEASVANGWRSGAWYNMWDNLNFAETLFDAGITNVVRIAADGWYDTHGNQKENLSNNLQRVAEKTAQFYNNVKDKHNVTIILYSEFWRTLKINSSLWTDHWKWGGMFILSNNQEWKNQLPEKVYGNNSFKDAQANRLWVGIDYRSVYKKAYETLYNQDISESLWWEYEISNYIDNTPPEPKLFRTEFSREWSRIRAHLKFRIDDANYYHKQWSHIRFSYWSNPDNLRSESRHTIDRYMVDDNKNLKLYMRNLNPNTQYFYEIEIFDNQYNTTLVQWDFTTPEYKNSGNKKLERNKNTFLSQFNWTKLNNNDKFNTNIELSSSWVTQYLNNPDIILEAWSWSEIMTVSGSWTTWNWGFIIPTEVRKNRFISNLSNYNNTKLDKFKNIEKIIHVWSDTLWVSMNLNMDVDLKVKNISTSKNLWVITSQDGITWTRVNQNKISKQNGEINIKTDHFSYFAIVELDKDWEIDIIWDSDNTDTSTKKKSSSWGSKWRSFKKDNCPYWDYSVSYYDKTCWKQINSKEVYQIANSFHLRNNLSYNIENDQINNALDDLALYDSQKFDIFYEIFDTVDVNNQYQKNTLKYIREKVTQTTIWDYEFYYFQWSQKNAWYNKVVKALTQQWYKKEYESELIKSLNDLLLIVNIRQNIEANEVTKKKINSVVQNKLNSLKHNYILAKNNKKPATYVMPKQVKKTDFSQKDEAYYRSRKEEIIRRHKQK